jgi:hypothetical protein
VIRSADLLYDMEGVYEQLAAQWSTCCEDPFSYTCQSTISKWTNPDTLSNLQSLIVNNKSHCAFVCGHHALLLKQPGCSAVICVDRFADLFIGLVTGKDDVLTTYEILIGGVVWGEVSLEPGVPTFVVRGTHIIPTIGIAFQKVIIKFTGPVPKSLYYIGGILLNEQRKAAASNDHKCVFSNGDIGTILNQSAFVHKHQKIPLTALEVPDMTKIMY